MVSTMSTAQVLTFLLCVGLLVGQASSQCSTNASWKVVNAPSRHTASGVSTTYSLKLSSEELVTWTIKVVTPNIAVLGNGSQETSDGSSKTVSLQTYCNNSYGKSMRSAMVDVECNYTRANGKPFMAIDKLSMAAVCTEPVKATPGTLIGVSVATAVIVSLLLVILAVNIYRARRVSEIIEATSTWPVQGPRAHLPESEEVAPVDIVPHSYPSYSACYYGLNSDEARKPFLKGNEVDTMICECRQQWFGRFSHLIISSDDVQLGKTLTEGCLSTVTVGALVKHSISHGANDSPGGVRAELNKLKKKKKGGNVVSEKVKDVTIKFLKCMCAPTDLNLFIKEVSQLQGLEQHSNVMQVIALCLDCKKPPLACLDSAVEYNLKRYLVNQSGVQYMIPLVELVSYCVQVCSGCAFLASKGIVHGDIAARNCWVTKENVVKLSCTASSRDVFPQEYSEDSKHRHVMPVRWMAPECFDTGKFQTASDVWSFGILLWEVTTLCNALPYDHLGDNEVEAFLLEGHRLQQTSYCPSQLFTIMNMCWDLKPAQRPNFPRLSEKLTKTYREVANLVPVDRDSSSASCPRRTALLRPRSESNDSVQQSLSSMMHLYPIADDEGAVTGGTGLSRKQSGDTRSHVSSTMSHCRVSGHAPSENVHQSGGPSRGRAAVTRSISHHSEPRHCSTPIGNGTPILQRYHSDDTGTREHQEPMFRVPTYNNMKTPTKQLRGPPASGHSGVRTIKSADFGPVPGGRGALTRRRNSSLSEDSTDGGGLPRIADSSDLWSLPQTPSPSIPPRWCREMNTGSRSGARTSSTVTSNSRALQSTAVCPPPRPPKPGMQPLGSYVIDISPLLEGELFTSQSSGKPRGVRMLDPNTVFTLETPVTACMADVPPRCRPGAQKALEFRPTPASDESVFTLSPASTGAHNTPRVSRKTLRRAATLSSSATAPSSIEEENEEEIADGVDNEEYTVMAPKESSHAVVPAERSPAAVSSAELCRVVRRASPRTPVTARSHSLRLPSRRHGECSANPRRSSSPGARSSTRGISPITKGQRSASKPIQIPSGKYGSTGKLNSQDDRESGRQSDTT